MASNCRFANCKMTKRKIGAVCGTALLIAAAVVIALRDRSRVVPLPEVSAVVPVTEVRVKAVERKAEPLERGDVAAALGAVAIVCGMDEATADRYEARNDALRSIARSEHGVWYAEQNSAELAE